MTLRRRLFGQLALLLGCMAVTAGVGLWEVRAVRQDFSLALDRYEKLRGLYEVGFHLQSARLALTLDFPDAPRARLEARRAEQIFRKQAGEPNAASMQIKIVADSLAATAAAMQRGRPTATALDAPYAELQRLVDQYRGEISAAQTAADRRKRSTILWLGGVAAAALAVSIVTALRQYQAVMRPLAATAAGVRRVAAGEFRPALQLYDADAEFAALAGDFNQMAARLEATLAGMQQRVESATRNLVQSERLAGIGLLAAGVAHEVNNPLSIITGRLELMQASAADDATRACLGELIEEGFRCKAIIDRLLQLSRGPSGERTRVRLDTLARSAVDSIRALPAAAGRELSVEAAPATATADAGELRQVIVNLIINAINFTAPGQAISLAVRAAAGRAEIEVRDGGIGMNAEELARLFEPFFSTRRNTSSDSPRGTGLGLAISRAIIDAHGGQIDAFSDGPGRGSRFVVSLPLADDEAA